MGFSPLRIMGVHILPNILSDIVVVASVAGLRGGANEAVYAGTKAAVEQMGLSLAFHMMFAAVGSLGLLVHLAVLGVTAYRSAFGERRAQVGPQGRTVAGTRVWVLPNPSGLNAHETIGSLAEWYRRVGEAAGLL